MDFNHFIKYIPKIEKEISIATIAHEKMMPSERKILLETFNYEEKKPKKAAVLILFYPKNKQTHLVLILRNTYKGVHSAQIGFPGGKVELSDKDLEHTALRETEEEIGILKEKIKIIKAFSEVYVPPSNFLVAPFLGFSNEELLFLPNDREVKNIIELPISTLLDEKIVTKIQIDTSYAKSIEVPAFRVGEHVVWGATAMMLSELKDVMKKVYEYNG